MKNRKFGNVEVRKTFNNFPKNIRENLLLLRELIFDTAAAHEEIGEIEETLKWGDPSYLTIKPKSGTTIRLSASRTDENKFTISVHCQTSLISEFKAIYPELNYSGNRSIVFDIDRVLPDEAINDFIYLALTYHYRNRY